MSIIVLDPGHGGSAHTGGSSPNNATGPNGLLEKNLTLDLAQRMQRLLAGDDSVILTRTGDTNLSLAARAEVARSRNADVFLSIHFNGWNQPSTDGTETWVAESANQRSVTLAGDVLRRLVGVTAVADRGVRRRNLGVLLASRHAASTAACLAEVAFLTNPQQAARLLDERYREDLASAMCEAVRASLPARAAVGHALAAAAGGYEAPYVNGIHSALHYQAGSLAVVGAGRAEVDCPLLNSHGSPTRNLVLLWNVPPASYTQVDVLVHLHGFAAAGRPLDLRRKAANSGIGFSNPSNAQSTRQRPLLGMVPRGYATGATILNGTVAVYDFPKILENRGAGLTSLLDFGLNWFGTNQLGQPAGSLRRGRLILTAHSGGGARLMQLLTNDDPNEIHLFDALYAAPTAAVRWAERHIADDAAALGSVNRAAWSDHMTRSGGALRAVFHPTNDTTPHNTALHNAIECALRRIANSDIRDFLRGYYRVESTSEGHNDIPLRFGSQLLVDASSDLNPAVRSLPTPRNCPAPAARSSSLDPAYAFDVPAGVRIPSRPSGAMAGSAFIQSIMNMGIRTGWEQRENAIFEQLRIGNIPAFLRTFKDVPVSFTERNGTRHEGLVRVMPDILSIGSNDDYVLIPMDAITAQRVADEYGCILPTAKLVDATFAAAQIQLVARPRDDYRYSDHRQVSTNSYMLHDRAIKEQMRGRQLGALVEGHKKNVVISALLSQPAFRNKLAFYGWFDANRRPIQGRNGIASVAHEPTYADYSHGVRMVAPNMTADGQSMTVADVLRHPVLHRLLSNEGPITTPRITASRPR